VVEVRRLVRLVRLGVERVAALDAVGLDGAARGRRGAAAVALVQLHPTELVVERRGAIAHARALGLPGMGRLRARVERVCARPRARRRGRPGERGARLVVGNVRLARVGEERQDGGDALRRGGAAGRDGDEESGRLSGTTHKPALRMSLLHQMVVDCRGTRISFVLEDAHRDFVPFPPPDWMIKTSLPRTLSSISTLVSPPLNLSSSTFAGGMPRWLQMVLRVC
jgi:hypothetical protein